MKSESATDIGIEQQDSATNVRLHESQAFADGLRSRYQDLTLLDDEDQRRNTSISNMNHGIDDRLLGYVARLRKLSEPRTALPSRIARYRLFNWGPIRKCVLRFWNYFSRPGRLQSQIMADSIDLICLELERIAGRGNNKNK